MSCSSKEEQKAKGIVTSTGFPSAGLGLNTQKSATLRGGKKKKKKKKKKKNRKNISVNASAQIICRVSLRLGRDAAENRTRKVFILPPSLLSLLHFSFIFFSGLEDTHWMSEMISYSPL
jgi:hypothetical protein